MYVCGRVCKYVASVVFVLCLVVESCFCRACVVLGLRVVFVFAFVHASCGSCVRCVWCDCVVLALRVLCLCCACGMVALWLCCACVVIVLCLVSEFL